MYIETTICPTTLYPDVLDNTEDNTDFPFIEP